MEEIVDVVDEKDEVVYQVSKKEAHQKGLLHRIVISEIRDTAGNWIMTRQASDRQDAGQYVSPIGGHVTAGETEDEALIREAEEEFGIKDLPHKLIGKVIFNRHVLGRQENHYFILYEIYSDQKEFRTNHEVESYKSFTTEKLKRHLREHPKDFGDAFHFLVKTFYPELLED